MGVIGHDRLSAVDHRGDQRDLLGRGDKGVLLDLEAIGDVVYEHLGTLRDSTPGTAFGGVAWSKGELPGGFYFYSLLPPLIRFGLARIIREL